MQYRLRTLLIVLALGPPLIAGGWWGWSEYREWRERERLLRALFAPFPEEIVEIPIRE